MALEEIHLDKALMLMGAEDRLKVKTIRAAISSRRRKESRRAQGLPAEGGGSFYLPFWAAAKEHALGRVDLTKEVIDEFIERDPRRKKKYPLLRTGFLLWWDKRRKWTNGPFSELPSVRNRFSPHGVNETIKVENLLCTRDAANNDHYVYPYFYSEPILTTRTAKMGLWIITQAFPTISEDALRILDVMRGKTYAISRDPFSGSEGSDFLSGYRSLRVLHDELLDE